MTLHECAEEGCNNASTSPFSCSVCDEFKCIDCMTDSALSICKTCDEEQPTIQFPTFEKWDGKTLRSWFYAGFIEPFYERCDEGEEFTFYCSFVEFVDGFSIILPKTSWNDIEHLLEKAQSEPLEAQLLLDLEFHQFKFPSPITIEDAFSMLQHWIMDDDPWWVGLSIEVNRFDDDGPLPWPDHGRIIVTLSMKESDNRPEWNE
jgi:hypothetical protein